MMRSHEIDMTSGPLLNKIILFTLPVMASGVLQLLFNAADIVVVGKFAGSMALAAVGATGSLINLIVNVFIGFATAANVMVSRYYGAQDEQQLSRCIHCSIGLSGLLGILVCLIGFFFSVPMLRLTNVEPDVLSLAALYLKIYFLGAPAILVYNFGAAILRAVGDTERPLRFLMISGLVNVGLNLILVIVFRMDVAGVAIATAVSQYVAAVLVIRCLIRSSGAYRLTIKNIRLYGDMVLRLLQVGLPAGLQGSVFSIANVLIQSSINSFGYVTIAANSASSNIDGFIYITMNSVYHASLSFTSQNYGAKQYDRIKRVIFNCLSVVVIIGVVVGGLVYLFGPNLLSLYISASDPNRALIIETGMIRLTIIGLSYFLCGIMEALTGALRGLGKSWTPMIISALGACAFRVIWIFTIFTAHHTLEILYLSYPISWIITPAAQTVALVLAFKALRNRNKRQLI